MFKYIRDRKGVTPVLEYIMLIVILLLAVLFTQKYIVRGMAGRWKAAGDTYGFGRQFNLSNTIECGYLATDRIARGYIWYEKKCYRNCQDGFDSMGCYAACFRGCNARNQAGGCSTVDRTQCVSCCTNYCNKQSEDSCACQCDTVKGCDENVC